jgi:hypothetical protein
MIHDTKELFLACEHEQLINKTGKIWKLMGKSKYWEGFDTISTSKFDKIINKFSRDEFIQIIQEEFNHNKENTHPTVTYDHFFSHLLYIYDNYKNFSDEQIFWVHILHDESLLEDSLGL